MLRDICATKPLTDIGFVIIIALLFMAALSLNHLFWTFPIESEEMGAIFPDGDDVFLLFRTAEKAQAFFKKYSGHFGHLYEVSFCKNGKHLCIQRRNRSIVDTINDLRLVIQSGATGPVNKPYVYSLLSTASPQ
ncbi:MAG: hypothetical protein K1X28_08915 [Parachlamydiales bacterium]|nr:hypothetical protein [Parachlamydiales bacterium]